MAKKISNLTFVFLIFLFLLISLVKTLVFPNDINTYENRKANVVSPVSATAFSDGSFQDSVENALSDQAFFSQKIKKIYNLTLSVYMYHAVAPLKTFSEDNYVKIGAHYLYGRDNLLFEPYVFSQLTERLDARAQLYNSVFEKYSDTDFYVYYIEKDTDLNFEKNEKMYVYDYLAERMTLPESNRGVFRIDNFEDFDKYFYETDHHWKAEGSKLGYEQVIKMLLGEDEPLIQPTSYIKIENNDFSGSKTTSAMTGSFFEPFWVYEYNYTPMTITENGVPIEDYGCQTAYINGTKKDSISYGLFYGGDSGEIIFDTSRPEKENILIIGESYDNAILKLVASHFNRTVSIDLRSYENYMGKKFSLEDCIKTNSIDKVLLIGNVDYYLSDDFVLE